MGFYVVPVSSEGLCNFRHTVGGKRTSERIQMCTDRVNDNEFLYVNSFYAVLK
jgi:hypothetical protein